MWNIRKNFVAAICFLWKIFMKIKAYSQDDEKEK